MTDDVADAGLVDVLLAALDEAPKDDHGRILQRFLLDAVNDMAAHTAQQIHLLEQVALLAVNNVQDVRLHSLEARVRELEHGKPVTFGDVLGELFFGIAFDAALILGATYGAAAVTGAAGYLVARGAVAARSTRVTRRLRTPPLRKAEATLDARLSRLAEERGAVLRDLRGLPPRRSLFRPTASAAQNARRDALQARLQRARDEVAWLDQNREIQLTEGVEVEAAEWGSAVSAGLSSKLATFKETFDTYARSRAESAVESVVEGLAESSSQDAPPGFTTTGCATQMIASLEWLAVGVRDHYAQMRSLVAFTDPDDLLESVEGVVVLREVEEHLFATAETTEVMLADLDAFVAPMEVAVWLLVLETNGLLDRDETATTATHSGPVDTGARFVGPGAGDLVLDVLDHRSFGDSPRMTVRKLTYAGVPRIDEGHASYLYHRFVAPVLDQLEGRIPRSSHVEPGDFVVADARAGRYDDVLAMPRTTFLGGVDRERRDLVHQMSVLVIEFFRFVRERMAERGSVGLTGAVPGGTPVSDVLAAIDRPPLPELPDDPDEALDPQVWAAAQQASVRDQLALARLADLGGRYRRALSLYEHRVAAQPLYAPDLGPQLYTEMFMTVAETELRAVRAEIESIVLSLEDPAADPPPSDAVLAEAERLRMEVASCPVTPTLLSTFPR